MVTTFFTLPIVPTQSLLYRLKLTFFFTFWKQTPPLYLFVFIHSLSHLFRRSRMISKFLLPGDDRELFFFLNTMITVVSHRDHFKTSSKSWSHCWWLFQNVNQRPQVHVHLKQCSPVSPLTEMFAWSLLSLSSVWRWRSCEGTRWPGPPCGCARAARPWCGGGGPGHHPAKTTDRVCKNRFLGWCWETMFKDHFGPSR